MSAPGVLYGVGVGPGDPQCLTLRAVEVLGRADVILAAASSKNDHSIALGIAKPHLRADIPVVELKFPMTRDPAVLRAAWERNARVAADQLLAGRNAAFLTLGDPMLYSTFGYLARTLANIHPDLPIEVVSGITSFQAAAARTRTILAEAGESLLVLSGAGDEATLDRMLGQADNVVVLKTYRNFEAIRRLVQARGLGGQSVFVSRLGLEGETICRDLSAAPDQPTYLSLLLIKNGGEPGAEPGDGGGAQERGEGRDDGGGELL